MPDQDTVLIPLRARDGSIRAYTLIDASDNSRVEQSDWRLHSTGYAYRSSGGRGSETILWLHRVLLDLPQESDGREVDHINRDRLDNRRENLRIISHAENLQNQPGRDGGTSPHRGVHWHSRDQMWRARIRVDGKNIDLGQFVSESEAAEVARSARMRLMPFSTD